MHRIDPKWTDLAAGYQTVQLLQNRLESEFGHALQAGHKQKYRKQLTQWQKKRRIFFVMAAIAPLSVITLCLAAYYYHDAACVIVYWALLVVVILVTLAVAGRNYIREVMSHPRMENAKTKTIDLDQCWWDSLSPAEAMVDKGTTTFLTALEQALPESCLVINTPELLLLSPSGLWLFLTESSRGTIIRQDGVWKQIQNIWDKWLRKINQEQTMQVAPDNTWLDRKNDLVRVLKKRLPQREWGEKVIQGGVVFTHPKAHPDKARIQGNTAGYGSAKEWVERLRSASAEDGFPLETQLEILEADHERMGEQAASAKEQARLLYQAAADELRQSIAKMMN